MWLRNWLKKQVTEMTAWAGIYLFAIAMLNEPYWLNIVIGVLLISIDDEKARAFVQRCVPWLQRSIDKVGSEADKL